jgi:hypothetical protein
VTPAARVNRRPELTTGTYLRSLKGRPFAA